MRPHDGFRWKEAVAHSNVEGLILELLPVHLQTTRRPNPETGPQA